MQSSIQCRICTSFSFCLRNNDFTFFYFTRFILSPSLPAPSVPCVVITPVAPHSLSFRPIVIPETALIEITLPMSSKANGRVSFDGRGSMRLLRGSTIRAQTAFCPLPQVTAAGKDTDWYEGIREKLHWNQQLR